MASGVARTWLSKHVATFGSTRYSGVVRLSFAADAGGGVIRDASSRSQTRRVASFAMCESSATYVSTMRSTSQPSSTTESYWNIPWIADESSTAVTTRSNE